MVSRWAWVLFIILVLSAIAFDLGFLGRRQNRQAELSVRSATLRSAAWIGLALLFGLGVALVYGRVSGIAYLTAYLLEESLSVDNIFVFVLIFSQLRIPPQLQRGVLLWGVLGALVMRGLLIGAGLFVLSRFHWVVYPFAALIIFAAVRLLWGQKKEREIVVAACSVCSTWVARLIPISPQFHDGKFLVRQGGRLLATPLFVALVIVETTDIVFALDSVPAVLAITRDPFIVYTSNVFAMLGLRSLYFVLAGAVERFRYLRVGLAAILVFFGARLLLSDVVEFPNHISLAVIAVALGLSVLASVKWPGVKTA
ncbi:MAG TPA: TerC/Alx family metal homeostasis membrane protein [Gemmatimonadaceae bacterium]|nr:TerC/Alx family metal homeostasis membrane protein [Gemmatimonadaceae bacterium]